jgi:hypothetical protein
MFLIQNGAGWISKKQRQPANLGDRMTTASDIFSQIEEFLTLSNVLNLSRAEEQTLMSLDAEEWERWRSMTIAPNATVPSLLIRRLDYAVALLTRMASATTPCPNWTGPGESRV